MTEAAIMEEPSIGDLRGSIRVDDKMKLRELELATQYELKYLSDSFTDLRRYVKGKLDTESDRFEVLNKKVNWLMYVILAQLAGVDMDMLMSLVSKIPA